MLTFTPKAKKIVIAGFGRTKEGVRGVKYKAETVVKEIYEQEFFAGGDGVDTCSGDSGGPVFAKDSFGEMKLIGVTSRGSAFCLYGGIYGRTDTLLEWKEFQIIWDVINALPAGSSSIKDGAMAMNSGDYKNAVKHFSKSYESGVESVKNFALLAAAYAGSGYDKAHSGDIKGAKEEYKKAFRFRAKSWEKKGEKYYDEALADITKAIEIDPSDPSLYDDRANIYILVGANNKASEDLKMSSKLRSNK